MAFLLIMATKKQKSAWSKVNTAILTGLLVRRKCRCGSRGFSLAHHTDYDKPLDIEFKCYKCHRIIHHLEHFACTNLYPDYYESDLEKGIFIENVWDECVRIIDNECYIKGRLQTAII